MPLPQWHLTSIQVLVIAFFCSPPRSHLSLRVIPPAGDSGGGARLPPLPSSLPFLTLAASQNPGAKPLAVASGGPLFSAARGWLMRGGLSKGRRRRAHGSAAQRRRRPPDGRAVALRLVVVAISFVGGGQPESGWSDLEIRHLVPAASREDTVAGETKPTAGDGSILRRYLDEGIVDPLVLLRGKH